MKRRETTVENLEAYQRQLQGPLGVMLQAVGVIIATRLREQKRDMMDLTDQELMDLLYSAMLEAAPAGYPQVPRDELDAALDDMFAQIAMQMAANSDGGETRN